MHIYYNNKLINIPDASTIFDCLNTQEEIEHKAVWLNGEHISLELFEMTKLKENDRIKVVRIRGGG